MSSKIVLSQTTLLALAALEQILSVLKDNPCRLKDVTLETFHDMEQTEGDHAVNHLIKMKARFTSSTSSKAVKVVADIYVRAHPKGGPTPSITEDRVHFLYLEDREYRAHFWKGSLKVFQFNPVSPNAWQDHLFDRD